MKCPPAVLAATFVLQAAIFYWKFICLIEDTKPNLEHLASLGKTGLGKKGLGKTGAAFLKAAPGEIGARAHQAAPAAGRCASRLERLGKRMRRTVEKGERK